MFSCITNAQGLKVVEFLISKINNLKGLIHGQSNNDTDVIRLSNECALNICLKYFSALMEKLVEDEIVSRISEIQKPFFSLLPYPKMQLQAS